MYSNNTFLLVCVWEEISVESTGGGRGYHPLRGYDYNSILFSCLNSKEGEGRRAPS